MVLESITGSNYYISPPPGIVSCALQFHTNGVPRASPPPLHPYTSFRTLVKTQAIVCPMRPVVCPACNNKVVGSALERHRLETCPQRTVMCEKGCGESVPVSGVLHHLHKVDY